MRTDLVKRCINFGHALLRTGDLDPIYTALNKAQLDTPDLHNVCMAYWLFYDLGVATRAANMVHRGDLNLYEWLKLKYPTLRRGTERRHFRGVKGEQCLDWLDSVYDGSSTVAIEHWFTESTFGPISRKVQKVPQFGPWIAFKVADMGQACLGHAVSFDDCKLAIYREPYKAAQLLLTGDKETKLDIEPVLELLLREFAHTPCPHDLGRGVRLQEVETILCKFKSHLNGHYPIGKDSHEYAERLSKLTNPLARALAQNLPTLTA